MKAITVNIGSRSIKYSYYEDDLLLSTTELDSNSSQSFKQFVVRHNIEIRGAVVGIRIVAPGSAFCEHSLITDEYLGLLKKSQWIAPLHTERVVKEIEDIKTDYPDLKIIAISDSNFHKSIPDYLKYYAISREIREKYSLVKQGYHGLSLGSIVNKIKQKYSPIPQKIAVAHLGGGSSVTALLDGMSVDTSMGFTPIDGIPMAERIGSIDAGALLYLGREEAMSYDELLNYISHSCGLEAVSEVEHGDLKEIIDHANDPDSPKHDQAQLAIHMYTISIAKQISAMSVALHGLDMLIFTGTVGELSAPIRAKICSHLLHFNIVLDPEKNEAVTKSGEIQLIDKGDNDISCAVIFTDESKEMQIALKQFASTSDF